MTTIQFDLNVPQSRFLQLQHKVQGLRGGVRLGQDVFGLRRHLS